MKKSIALAFAAAAGAAAFAAPVVSDVTMSQDGSRTVTINYTLSGGEPGIVTVDIQTNRGDGVWVSIGGKHLTYFAGDANKLVQPGSRTITWKPRKAWPDNEVTENVKAVVSAWATNAPPDYMVVSLAAAKSVNYYTCAENVPFGVENDMYKTEYLVMRKIPAANVQWRMGSPTTESPRNGTREVPHLVTLGEDYYIGVYEVTQRQWELLMNNRPSQFTTDYATRPVEYVSYEAIRGKAKDGYDWPNDGHDVCNTNFVGVLRKLTGMNGFDLPTEAQWEFACRAGCGSMLYNGTELESNWSSVRSANLSPIARYALGGGKVLSSQGSWVNPTYTVRPANGGTAKVGSLEANAWGLYDMLGNVFELCLDWYQDDVSSMTSDPKGPKTGSYRVYRGGGWYINANNCRCAFRGGDIAPNQVNHGGGFRLAYFIGL